LRDTANSASRKNGHVPLRWMDNVGIVVESLDAAIAFFAELGLELEGRSKETGPDASLDYATSASRWP
jgi:hypothetical protein